MNLPILTDAPDLTFPTGETNAGGIARLRLVPAQLLTMAGRPERFPLPQYVGKPEHTVQSSQLIFAEGASLLDIELVPDYCSFTDAMEPTVNGNAFRHAIQLILPKVRPEVIRWVQRYSAVRWVGFLQDRNGLCRMAGTPEHPLQVDINFGQATGKGSNQTTMNFTAMVDQPAYLVAGIEDADLIHEGAFDTTFQLMFDS